MLIESPELAKAVTAKKVQSLDARPKAKYDAGHVPGAVWVDVPAWSKAFAAGPDKEAWVKLLGDCGLEPGAPVVVYGDDCARRRGSGGSCATGASRTRGCSTAAGRPGRRPNGAVSRESRPVEATKPKLTAHADRLATKDQVLEQREGQGPADHRRPLGEGVSAATQKMAKRGGAIPGAKHLEWSDLLDKDGRFKSADELRKLFKEHDVSLKEPAVTYCQSGGRASVMAFALELMGAKDVRNYYRSWNEWGNDPDTPIVTPRK